MPLFLLSLSSKGAGVRGQGYKGGQRDKERQEEVVRGMRGTRGMRGGRE